jgi:hypothetical protein
MTYCAETWCSTRATLYISAQNYIKDVLRRTMVYYLGHVVHIYAEPYKDVLLRNIWCTTWATWYISAQNTVKDVLRRDMVYYLGHMVHICAEPYKRCTVQKHGVLPGPRGTFLRRTL